MPFLSKVPARYGTGRVLRTPADAVDFQSRDEGQIEKRPRRAGHVIGCVRPMSGDLTYVTDEMRAARGRWGKTRTAAPITDTDIRRWAIATFYPEKPPRIYWDPAYAATTRWGGIVAPPDFNPFAWSFDRGPSSAPGMRGQRPDGSAVTGMNGGQTDTYGVPMRAGDVITERSRLIGWWEQEGRLGHTLFVRSEIEWRNHNGEHVRTRLSIGVRF